MTINTIYCMGVVHLWRHRLLRNGSFRSKWIHFNFCLKNKTNQPVNYAVNWITVLSLSNLHYKLMESQNCVILLNSTVQYFFSFLLEIHIFLQLDYPVSWASFAICGRRASVVFYITDTKTSPVHTHLSSIAHDRFWWNVIGTVAMWRHRLTRICCKK